MTSYTSPAPAEPLDANATYLDPDAIKRRYTYADALMGIPVGASKWSGLTGLITGAGGGYLHGQAERALQQNQALSAQQMRAAINAPDSASAAKALAAGQNPALQQTGLAKMFDHWSSNRITPLQQAELDIKRRGVAADEMKARAAYESVPRVAVNPVTGELYDQRATDQVGQQQSGTIGEKIFNRKFAEGEAPKLFSEAGKSYADSAAAGRSFQEMLALAPHARTGFAAEQELTLRRLASTVLGINDPKIKASELFRALSQDGILNLVGKLKPVTNNDVVFVTNATASLKSDPSTLPLLLPHLINVAERSAVAERLKMGYLRRGLPPDMGAISAEVDRLKPSVIERAYAAGAASPGAARSQASPQASPPAASQFIETRRNPRTGEMVGLTREGVWVKIETPPTQPETVPPTQPGAAPAPPPPGASAPHNLLRRAFGQPPL